MLIERVYESCEFPHAVKTIEVLETHISWVILAGDYAYKIKKPVQFDFVDYSTLEKRKAYCALEVELNQRFAKELYLGVVPIVEQNDRLKVLAEDEHGNDVGPIVEYAVKMRRFPQEAIAAACLRSSGLSSDSVQAFAKSIATFHASIEIAPPDMACVQPDRIVADAIDNPPMIKTHLRGHAHHSLLDDLASWTVQQARRLKPKFERRLAEGKVRRCHGDLHLKNIIRLDGRLMAFDGIEFNEQFQWIDVLSEIAFPVMDCFARGCRPLAWLLLNAYLEESGDYEDLDVLRFYLVYRAMVRAKVTCLNPANAKLKTEDFCEANPQSTKAPWDKYLRTAAWFAFSMQPRVDIMHGLSGSGKSAAALELIDRDGGIRVRSDVERIRLVETTRPGEKYSQEATEHVYNRLLTLASKITQSQFPVVVDATFLSGESRASFQKLAAREGLPFRIIDCQAPYDELCTRIRQRTDDPSEADIAVLDEQIRSQDVLTPNELGFVSKE